MEDKSNTFKAVGTDHAKGPDRQYETAFMDDKRIGFTNNSRLYLQRCPKCERQNWAMAVATGQCAWCGWKPEETPLPVG